MILLLKTTTPVIFFRKLYRATSILQWYFVGGGGGGGIGEFLKKILNSHMHKSEKIWVGAFPPDVLPFRQVSI